MIHRLGKPMGVGDLQSSARDIDRFERSIGEDDPQVR